MGERTGEPKADRYVISRSEASGAPTVLEPRTGTLRSVHTLNTVYADAAGKPVASYVTHQAWKSGVNPGTGKMTWVEDGTIPHPWMREPRRLRICLMASTR